MMKGSIDIMTRTHDYGMPSTSEKSKEAENPALPLQIENMLGEILTRIPKGAFKKASHNPNARATQNYYVVEDLSKPLVRCLLWKSSRPALPRERLC
jgi:hypothetical protein